MRIPLNLLAALAVPMMLATPAAASPAAIDSLVHKARGEAAWQGVELERIVRKGQDLKLFGHDRSGRDVTLETSCGDLGFICESQAGGGFSARPR